MKSENGARTFPPGRWRSGLQGAKISTKVGMLHRLLKIVDKICIGGQLANVFLAAQSKYQSLKFSADDGLILM